MKISPIEVTLIDHCGSDLSVVNAARVSMHKESEWVKTPTLRGLSQEVDLVKTLQDKDVKLINYLASHKHFSPFNHSFLSFRVKAPIFVARQLVKHKFMPWNEVSRRYVDEEPEFYTPDTWRKRADNVKQGSSEEVFTTSNSSGKTIQQKSCEMSTKLALDCYLALIREGVCPEQARMVLPQNTMTEWIWSGTLGAFCDMLRLRLDPHTQKESRDVSEKIYEIVKGLFPVSTKALLNGN